MNTTRIAANAAARQDLYTFSQMMYAEVYGQPFQKNWHLEAMAHQLERVSSGHCKRLLITVPPRSLKSSLSSIMLPAFSLGRNPRKKIICASYSDTLVKDLSRACKRVMESNRYKEVFGDLLRGGEKNSESHFETHMGGFRYSTSVGATLTGMGGSLIIIDDPIKTSEGGSALTLDKTERWLRETVLSRLDDKQNDSIILIMQRLNVADLAGFVLAQGGWDHLDFPAIAEEDQCIALGPNRFHYRKAGDVLFPAREPLHLLEEYKRTMGSIAFEAQYQQRPFPAQGNLVKRRWFRREAVHPQPNDRVILSIDPAMTMNEQSSYTAAVVLLQRGNEVLVYDVQRFRGEFPDVLKRIKTLHYKYHRLTGNYELVLEKGGGGLALSQTLKIEQIRAIEIDPEGDKFVRLQRQSAKIEAGYVILPEQADWMGDFEAELFAFPNGKFTDQVDAFSQGLDRAFFKKGRSGRAGISAYQI